MAEEILSRHIAVLYKKPTEVCQLYPIAHVLVEEGSQQTALQNLLDDPPKAKGYPRYAAVWKRLGAPVRQMGYCTAHPDDPVGLIVINTPTEPIQYLQPVETKKEVKVKVRGATGRLAKHFVAEYLKRAWTKADYGGQHMAQAKRVLGLGYTVEQVIDCLKRLERGDLTDGVPWVDYTAYHNFRQPGWSTLLCVLWGEPPAIEREVTTSHFHLQMTPEAFVKWREARKNQSLILDETPEETALRDFSKAPGWVEKDKKK